MMKFKKDIILHLNVVGDILAEDAGVGHDGAEYEHNAGEDPDGEGRYTLVRKVRG